MEFKLPSKLSLKLTILYHCFAFKTKEEKKQTNSQDSHMPPELLPTVMQVFRSFLRSHVGLILLTVETQQAVLITEMFHFPTPLHSFL
jgi:hypothetical protein